MAAVAKGAAGQAQTKAPATVSGPAPSADGESKKSEEKSGSEKLQDKAQEASTQTQEPPA